jgi:ribonuclease H2 subunit A
MVYGVALCALSDMDRLSKMGFMDSKVLKEETRDRLFADIRSSGYIGWKVDVIDPRTLSARMLDPKRSSLNTISYDSAIGLVRHFVDKGVLVQKLFVDTVGDAGAYQARLERLFPSMDITVCSKADALFPVVSAASICAKVSRDVVLGAWEFDDVPRGGRRGAAGGGAGSGSGGEGSSDDEDAGSDEDAAQRRGRGEDADGGADADGDADGVRDRDGDREGANHKGNGSLGGAALSAADQKINKALHALGSGYPGDPVTRTWLGAHRDRVFGFPSIVRFSWAPAKKAMEEHCVPVRWAEDDEEDNAAGGSAGSPLKKKPQARLGFLPVGRAKRHRFFEERDLRVVHSFAVVEAGVNGAPAKRRRIVDSGDEM